MLQTPKIPDFGRGVSAYDHFDGDRSRPGAAATLGPLVQGPFHAVQLKLGALGTNGGAKTNAAAQVLDVDGEPIPGLDGAGNAIARPTGSATRALAARWARHSLSDVSPDARPRGSPISRKDFR
jgi:hypothetical protein